MRNGAKLFLDTEVVGITKTEEGWSVKTQDCEFETKFVINAAGVWADDIHAYVAEPTFKITPSAGEYYLLDKSEGSRANHVIFQCDQNVIGVQGYIFRGNFQQS